MRCESASASAVVVPSPVEERPVKVTITRAMRDEYWSRHPDEIPAVLFDEGAHCITLAEAKAVLADAAFNADSINGPETMPASTRRAYAALARQLRKALDGVE